MKFLILLLAIKGLMPSKKTRKKLAKKWKRIHKAKKAVAVVKGKSDAFTKVTGIFRKVRFVLRCVSFVCISVPVVIVGLKGYKKIKPLLESNTIS